MSIQLPLFPETNPSPSVQGQWVIVLDDGETYAPAQDCILLFIPEGTDNPDRYVKRYSGEDGHCISVLSKLEHLEIPGDMYAPDSCDLDN